jgi:uncharacterized protein (TIGR03089 family)
VTRLIADRLRQRVRSRGADPLITYYDLGTGERTEFSATSFLNWVDKISNLLVDDYQLEAGAVLELELARTAPGHWVSLALEVGAWQVGATVSVGGPTSGGADLLVLGPDWSSHDRGLAEHVVACSLHPLGLGFSTPLPADVADFSVEVRGQPDFHAAAPLSGSETAWRDDSRQLSQADLVAFDAEPDGRRRLVRPTDPWSSVRDGLLVPLLADGSSVLVVGDDPARIDRIAETERAMPQVAQSETA